MTNHIQTHLRQNLVGYVALFFALSGTAVAAHERIFTSDIVDGTIQTVDIGRGQVRSAQVRDEGLTAGDLGPTSVGGSELDPEAFASGDIDPQSNGYGISPNAIQSSEIEDGQVTSGDVASNTLTGSDILESSLTDVPAATTARNVNGAVVQPIEFLASADSGVQTVFGRTQGLRIRAECTTGGDLEVDADTDRNARILTWSIDASNDEADNTWAIESWTAGGNFNPLPLVGEDDGDQSGQTIYMTSTGGVVIVNWAADNNTSPAFGSQCAFVGTAASH